MSEEKQKVDINPVQVVASALAAVSSAVLLSTVGVAGTVIGAAVGSLFATVGASLYSYSLRISRERVQAAQAAAAARMLRNRPPGSTRTSTMQLDPDEPDEPTDDGPPAWREALGRLPWKWIAILTGAVFVVAMIVILSFELLTGHSVSQYTGGTSDTGRRTSVSFGSSDSSGSSPTPTPTPTPSESTSPSASTSQTPTESTSPSGPADDSRTLTPSPSASSSSAPTTTTTAPTTAAPTTTAPTPSPTG